MIEFNLILTAAGKKTTPGMFWMLLIGTIAMLGFGYAGEIGAMSPYPAFYCGLGGWAFILMVIFVLNGPAECSPKGLGRKHAGSQEKDRFLGLNLVNTLRKPS